VELVTGTSGLKTKLRVPAVSRLQKIHNVDVALKGLEANGLEIKNLVANDIVVGHKEKTLSLIWQIIHNFQVSCISHKVDYFFIQMMYSRLPGSTKQPKRSKSGGCVHL
jgi:hypothetical protein